MTDERYNEIIKKREKYRSKAFYMMLEIGLIIALPAIVALIVGNRFANNKYTAILLVASFILSWIIIVRKYIKFNKHIKEIDNQIKHLKKWAY